VRECTSIDVQLDTVEQDDSLALGRRDAEYWVVDAGEYKHTQEYRVRYLYEDVGN
jgi:hypothetical protein